MDEFQDVLDEDGNLTGESKTKQQIFEDNDWRLVVHVWVVDIQGNLIIQKRADNMKFLPGMWDVSMGGGVDVGEESKHCAVRELQEELGIGISESDLKFIGRYKISKFLPKLNLNSNEFTDTYLLHKDYKLYQLQLQESEVAEVDKISLEQLLEKVRSENEKWVPHGNKYYLDVVNKIQNVIEE